MSRGRRSPARRAGMAVALAGSFLGSACGAGTDASPGEPTHFSTPAIRGVAVKPDGLTISVGDTLQMQALTIPDVPVTWQWSVVPAFSATVDETGLLRAVRPGPGEVYACADVPNRICGRAPFTVR